MARYRSEAAAHYNRLGPGLQYHFKIDNTGEIFWNTEKPNGTPRRKIDNERLFKWGWRPKVSFEEGLERTVNWFIENKDRFL